MFITFAKFDFHFIIKSPTNSKPTQFVPKPNPPYSQPHLLPHQTPLPCRRLPPGAVRALPAAPGPMFPSLDAPEPKTAYEKITWGFPEFGVWNKFWSGIPKFGASGRKPVSGGAFLPGFEPCEGSWCTWRNRRYFEFQFC